MKVLCLILITVAAASAQLVGPSAPGASRQPKMGRVNPPGTAGSGGTLRDSYVPADCGTFSAGGLSGRDYYAFTITPTATYTMSKIDLDLGREAGSFAGTLHVEVRADSGGHPGAIVANGTSGEDINIADLSTVTCEWKSFLFGTHPSVSSGVQYWVTVKVSVNMDPGYVHITGTDVAGGSTEYSADGSAWTPHVTGRKLGFATYD